MNLYNLIIYITFIYNFEKNNKAVVLKCYTPGNTPEIQKYNKRSRIRKQKHNTHIIRTIKTNIGKYTS